MSDEATFTTTTLVGNHVCMTEHDHDLLVSAVNIGIVATRENALLVEQLAAMVIYLTTANILFKGCKFSLDCQKIINEKKQETTMNQSAYIIELQEEKALLREVVGKIKRHFETTTSQSIGYQRKIVKEYLAKLEAKK